MKFNPSESFLRIEIPRRGQNFDFFISRHALYFYVVEMLCGSVVEYVFLETTEGAVRGLWQGTTVALDAALPQAEH